MSDYLPDEACHMRGSGEMQHISLVDVLTRDFSETVTLHNTMRFDVHLGYVRTMIERGEFDLDRVASKIRKAITQIVCDELEIEAEPKEDTGARGPYAMKVSRSKMLHREVISVDMS